jgi:hypothetical protein
VAVTPRKKTHKWINSSQHFVPRVSRAGGRYQVAGLRKPNHEGHEGKSSSRSGCLISPYETRFELTCHASPTSTTITF